MLAPIVTATFTTSFMYYFLIQNEVGVSGKLNTGLLFVFVVFESVGNFLMFYETKIGKLALIVPVILKAVTLYCLCDWSLNISALCSLIICGYSY